ncbi:heterokaryon incompatibility protein [Rutstroemia sp. NJR-2017a BVV2]|nr:heterokaryon incompatibility protein [Rutstroemia sp. NJR-2017a BVV2]
MSQNALYSYNAIYHNQLRLLKFLQDGNHISAVLETFSVEEAIPPYHALSYTWASNETGLEKPWAIQIGDRQLPVLDSLQPFVQTLRAKNMLLDGRWWWIDSICIDQTNLEERGQQVHLMESIYRRADQVIIWLGEGSSDSDIALDFIEFLNRIILENNQSTMENYNIEKLRRLDLNHYHPQWKALTNLLARKWWSRIWTIQEFVLSPNVTFWCGIRTVGRTALCHSILAGDQWNSVGMKETVAFKSGFNRRRVWMLYMAGKEPGVETSRSLLALAAYFCFMDATDDRDRLYGLMALSTDGSLLEVDYSLSSQEVYLGFTQAFIARHRSLDIICYASIYSAPSGLLQPSWVPDWQKRNYSPVIPLMVSQSCNPHIGNLRPPIALEYDPSIYYSASGNRTAVYEFQGSALLARGAIIDIVDGIAGSKNSEFVQSSEWKSTSLSDCSDSTCSPTEILTTVCRCLVLDRKDRYLRYAMPTENFMHDFLHLLAPLIKESPFSPPREFQDWFHRTKHLQIHGHSFESILRASHQAKIDFPESAPNLDELVHDSFFGRFLETVVKMWLRLMVSRNGCMGMVSEKAMKGDLVCVLFGCSVPVLLRESDSGDSFSLVGECFLDGYMDGLGLEQGRFEERMFCIR